MNGPCPQPSSRAAWAAEVRVSGGREGEGGPDHVPQPGPPGSPGTFLPCGVAAFPTNLPGAGGRGGGAAAALLG